MKKKTSEKSPQKKMPKNTPKNDVKAAAKTAPKTAVKPSKAAKVAASKPMAKKVAETKLKTAPKAPASKASAVKADSKKTGSVKVEAVKKTAAPKPAAKQDMKKIKTAPAPAPKPAKKEDKKKLAAKKGKTKEQDTDDDDFVTDDLGSSEIEEYQEELEAVEELDSEDNDEHELLEELVDENAEPEEVILTDAEGRRYCRVRDCDQISAVEGYCRYHYLLLWKKIQVRKKILVDGKLERYVEELTSRYPDKFLEMIKKDLKTEKDFLAAIAELEIDESAIEGEYEDDAQSFADEIRGMGTGAESPSMEDDEF